MIRRLASDRGAGMITPTTCHAAHLHDRLASDRGAGMITVIGLAVVALTLTASAAVMSISSLGSARARINFEMSLAAAESGIDRTMAQVQDAYLLSGADFPVPGTQSGTACQGTPVVIPASLTTEEAEASWARSEIDTLVASQGCVVDVSSGDGGMSGQYVVLKPAAMSTSNGRIYAMGWSPTRGAVGAKQRLVKVEYQFLPFAPSTAVLTQGNLELGASVTITSADGYPATGSGVHSNGSITTTGNPTVSGPVTSTGASSGASNNFTYNTANFGSTGVKSGSPLAFVPPVSAQTIHRLVGDLDPAATSTWHDLCPDGTIRPYVQSAPCGSTDTGSFGAAGVSYDAASHTWTVDRTAASGTYYAHQANITAGNGNHAFDNLTLIAGSETPEPCADKKYGNITWDHYGIAAPAVANTFMVADADLSTTSNFAAGSPAAGGVTGGMFVAGDQVSLQTSSQSVVGGVVAGDQCTNQSLVTSNEVKNAEVRYDSNAKSPFATIINQNLWLELPSQ